jgi:penicillin-binding protein 2
MVDVARVLSENEEQFLTTIATQSKKQSVFFVASDISKDAVLALRQLNVPGVYVITNTKRLYPLGQQFSTAIGYIGKVNKNDLAADTYYLQSDSIGRQGIEAAYENVLRGEHGSIFFSRGTGADIIESPVAGKNVVLHIDAEVQKALWSTLSGILREAGLSNAAAIAQDPRSGAIRAMVSFPSYDNNLLTGTVSQDVYTRLFESKTRPLFNRVIGGLYNPGSTIKPFIGMAALQEKIVSPSDTINDCISITIPNPLNPDDPYVFKNWRADTGLFSLRRAIAQSCNIYFFTVGGGHGSIEGLGVRRIVEYLKKAFTDTSLGIDLPGEESGFIPTPEWKLRTRKENWYQGDTYNISIGQGDLLVTPLWLNTYISAIANKGTLYSPQVAWKVIDVAKQPLEILQPTVLGQLPFSKENIEEMRIAMRETVRSGTAKSLQDLPVRAAAKTGTAEVVKGQSINSLFTVFAPYENPEITLTVLIEGSASNQGYAIQAANRFLQWYFTQGHQQPQLTPIPSTSPQQE